MIITFIGHGEITLSDNLKKAIKTTIINNIGTEKVLFYCGGYGNFDNACARILNQLKNNYTNIESIFVTPYLNNSRLKEIKDSKIYDDILYPDLGADLIIAYVKYDIGGAYKTLLYAKRKNKRIINLA